MADEQVTYIIRLKDMMSSRLRTMGIRIGSLTKSLRQGFSTAVTMATALLRKMAVGLGVATAALTAATYAAVRFGQDFLAAATNLEAAEGKFATVFRGVEDQATEMAEGISESMGLGMGTVMELMSTLQDTFVPMGFARDQATAFSGAMVRLATDLSVFNAKIRDPQQALEMLQSTLVGMHRSALNFGVVINEDTLAAEALALGLGNATGELTNQEKVMARLSLLLKGTADAQGYLLNNQEMLAVQTLKLREAVTDLKEEAGNKLRDELTKTIAQLGGVDNILLIVETAFSGVVTFLADYVIPAFVSVGQTLIKFITAAGGVEEATQLMKDGMKVAFKMIGSAIDGAALAFKLFMVGINASIAVVKLVGFAFATLASFLAGAFVSAVYLAVKVVSLLLRGLDSVVIFIKDIAITAFQGLVNIIADLIESIGSALMALGEFDLVPDFVRDAGVAAMEAAAGMRDFSGSLDDLQGGETILQKLGEAIDAFGEDSIMPVIDEIDRMTLALAELTVEEFSEDLKALGEDTTALQSFFAQVNEDAKLTGEEFLLLKTRMQAVIAEMENTEIASPEKQDAAQRMKQHLQDFADVYARIAAEAEKAKLETDELADSSDKAVKKFEGFGGGLDKIGEQIGTIGEQIANVTANAVNAFASGMADAIVSVVNGSASASEAFTKFAASFLTQIGQMIIQAAIFRAIRGFATGGVAEGLGELVPLATGGTVSGGLGRMMPLKGYATGGPIVDKPHIALIGEGKHNEAVVPLPDGKSIPVEMRGGGEGANVTVQIQALDARSVDELLVQRRQTLTEIIAQAVQESRQFRSAINQA